jgi:type IV pilus assembly protein PilQ
MDDQLVRRLNVTDFATPVVSIDTVRERDDRVRIVVNTTGDYDVLSYQTDNLRARGRASDRSESVTALRMEREEFVGERLSLNFQDIEVRSVLQLLADFTDLNIVVSDTVSGNITLRLNNVPWDQALDIILTSRGLDKRVSGNVMYVAPTRGDRGARASASSRPMRDQGAAGTPAHRVPIRELHAGRIHPPADLRSGLPAVSQRGSADVVPVRPWQRIGRYARTNTLIIRDTQDQIEAIRRLVNYWMCPLSRS